MANSQVSTDTTSVETNIHYPTNNNLVWDCIKVATRLLKKAKKDVRDEQDRLEKRKKESKKLNYDINNTKKGDGQKTLFDLYLSHLQDIITEVKQILADKGANGKIYKELNEILPNIEKVYVNSYRF